MAGLPSERFREAVRASTERALAQPALGVSYLLAEVEGELVASATLRVLASGIGYLQGAWVLPSFRGRGIYTALTQARLDRLAAQGIEQVCIWANPKTSGPVARRMGFVEVAHGAYHDVGG